MTEALRVVAAAAGDDLANLDTSTASEEGATMEIRHPVTGAVLRHDDGRAFTITLMGADSKAVIDLATKQQDRRIEQALRLRGKPVPSAVLERDQVELLVAATKTWDLILGGVVPPNKPEEFRKAYTKIRWLREQVQIYVDDRGNFLTA